MKKFYKSINAWRMTVEAMYTCAQKCTTGCKSCGDVCGTSPQTGAALIGTQFLNGSPDSYLVAIGSAVSPWVSES